MQQPVSEPGSALEARVIYRERIAPGPAYLVGAFALGMSMGLVAWIISEAWALGIGVPLGIVLAVALWFTAPIVVVERAPDGAVLRAANAWIPVDQLARPVELDSEGLRDVLGVSSDARAFGCLRPWMHSAVQVDVTDLEDPTPYWIVGTRHPARLLEALRSVGVTD
jgi:hypothetical protein